MSYSSDLRSSELKSLFLRHQDSYSANELQGEVYLVTSFISQLLSNADLTGNFNRQELTYLIDLKRKLLESQAKLKNLALREEIMVRQMVLRERLSEAITRQDFEGATVQIIQMLYEFVPDSKMERVISKLGSLCDQLKAK